MARDKKKALKEGRILVFIDESGLSQRPHRCRTWALRGQTPIRQYNFNWKTLSVAAGLTWWNFYFRIYAGAVKKEQIRAEFAPKPSEIVAREHWCSSGFANTDLDLQLKKHGVHQLIVIGLLAHTCVESTVRFAVELGYEVTLVKDATADYGEEFMHAARSPIFRITPVPF